MKLNRDELILSRSRRRCRSRLCCGRGSRGGGRCLWQRWAKSNARPGIREIDLERAEEALNELFARRRLWRLLLLLDRGRKHGVISDYDWKNQKGNKADNFCH